MVALPIGIERHRFDVGLEDLQTFLAVAEFGSFSLAAEHLNLSQPSISNRVRRLEEKLLVRLLRRTTRRVELTPQGERLYHQSSETLRGLRDLLQEFNKEASLRNRQVRVAATLTVATMGLPPVLRSFGESYPSITVLLHDLTQKEALERVADGSCDLGVMTYVKRSGVVFEPLMSDTCVVLTPLGHPLLRQKAAPFAEVVKYALLSPSEHAGLQAILDEAEKRNLVVRLSPESEGVSNLMTLLAMAVAGLGVCIYPSSFIPPEYKHLIGVVPIADCEIVRTFGIATAVNRPLSAAARAFCDVLRRSIAGSGRDSSCPTPKNVRLKTIRDDRSSLK